MANVEKHLNARFGLKYDSYENWVKNNPQLLKGEVAIATVTTKTGDGHGKVSLVPSVVLKVGDGTSTYTALPFVSAPASDVLEACKTEAGLTAYINDVIASAGIATDEALSQLSKNVDANADAIETLNGTGEGSVAKQIADAITALNLANTYEAKGAAAQALADAKSYADGKVAAEKQRAEGIESGLDSRLGTAEDEIDALQEQIGGLTGAMHFRGAVTADPTVTAPTGTYASGDVVLYSGKEYVYDGTTWYELGDEGSHITKSEVTQTYETKTDASQKLADAKAYTDQKNTEMDTRVQDLEDDTHTHDNKTTLDKVTEDHLSKIGSAVQNVAVATGDAGKGLKVERTGNDVTVGFDDTVTFVFDCGTSEI